MKPVLPAILILLAVVLVAGRQTIPEQGATRQTRETTIPAQAIGAGGSREASSTVQGVKATLGNPLLHSQKVITDIPLEKLGSEFRILGKTRRPLGELMTIQGLILDGECKGPDNPTIVVQRLNGRASQEGIRIKLRSHGHDYAGNELAIGKTYELRGYEEGGYVGTPAKVFEGGFWFIQTSDFYFHINFVAIKSKEIAPITFGPADFLDRFAVLEGEARSEEEQGYLVGKDWKLLVLPQSRWPAHMERKLVEVEGVMRATGQIKLRYVEGGRSQLVRLEDQLSRTVELKGQAWSESGHWWFQYRGTDLYVEKMDQLPGWSCEQHGAEVIITGTLEEAMLPRIDQITLKPDRDLQKYFIVRGAAWKPVPARGESSN